MTDKLWPLEQLEDGWFGMRPRQHYKVLVQTPQDVKDKQVAEELCREYGIAVYRRPLMECELRVIDQAERLQRMLETLYTSKERAQMELMAHMHDLGKWYEPGVGPLEISFSRFHANKRWETDLNLGSVDFSNFDPEKLKSHPIFNQPK